MAGEALIPKGPTLQDAGKLFLFLVDEVESSVCVDISTKCRRYYRNVKDERAEAALCPGRSACWVYVAEKHFNFTFLLVPDP